MLLQHALRALVAMLTLPYWTVAYALWGLDSMTYHMKIGDALLAMGLCSWASRHFATVLENGDSAWAHMQLGYALFQLREYDKGLLHYRRGYVLWPNPMFAVQLAKSEMDLGNLKEARELAEAAERERGHLDPFSLDMLDSVRRDLQSRKAGHEP